MAKTGIKDIAEIAGVDRSTVSLALNGSERVAEKTRRRIVAIAEEMNYRPNFLARGLAGQKTRSVGLLVLSLQDQFYVDVLAAMERTAKSQGYSPALSIANGGADNAEVAAIGDLTDRFVDGVAMAGVGGYDDEAHEKLTALAQGGMALSMYLESAQAVAFDGLPLDLTICDLGQGAYTMTRHLLEIGHRRIAYIGSGPSKLAGYNRALSEFGVAPDPSLVLEATYRYEEVHEIRAELMSLRDRPTAIFAYNDDLAAELIMELIEAGYRVPEHVSVAGINDGWHSRMLRVPLTTLRLPAARIGGSVTGMLIERIEDPSLPPRRREFEVELIVRDSTAPTEEH